MTRKKIDANQTAIVAELRGRGCSVQSLASIGDGCPDILCCYRKGKELFLFEIKNPAMPPSKRRLTDDEIEWQKNWSGPVYTIHSADEAWRVMIGYQFSTQPNPKILGEMVK